MSKQSNPQSGKSSQAKLTPMEKVQLQLETGCAQGTIAKWMAGRQVREATRRRLEKACAKLGLEVLA